jgi:hypothetical protein
MGRTITPVRKRDLIISVIVGVLVAGISSIALIFSSDVNVPPGIRTPLTYLGIPSLPGIVVGMVAAGNAHTGGALGVVLPVAIITNTIIYAAITYGFRLMLGTRGT